jgi:hypothetical protein
MDVLVRLRAVLALQRTVVREATLQQTTDATGADSVYCLPLAIAGRHELQDDAQTDWHGCLPMVVLVDRIKPRGVVTLGTCDAPRRLPGSFETLCGWKNQHRCGYEVSATPYRQDDASRCRAACTRNLTHDNNRQRNAAEGN